jgi:F-type H+-transporting ATPase subunit alpha
VGGSAQTKIISKLGGGIRIALAQYRELAAFAAFASDLDEATRAQLEHGKTVTELMKQKQYSPMSVAEMAIMLFSANEGHLKDVAIEKVGAFEASLLSFAHAEFKDLVDLINGAGKYGDDEKNGLKDLLEKFKATQTY